MNPFRRSGIDRLTLTIDFHQIKVCLVSVFRCDQFDDRISLLPKRNVRTVTKSTNIACRRRYWEFYIAFHTVIRENRFHGYAHFMDTEIQDRMGRDCSRWHIYLEVKKLLVICFRINGERPFESSWRDFASKTECTVNVLTWMFDLTRDKL